LSHARSQHLRKVEVEVKVERLDGFLDFAATQAASADPDALCLTIDQRPDWLEVGFEDSFGLVIGVTDVMTGLATLAAEIACICHGDTPSSSRMLKKPASGVLASLRGSTLRQTSSEVGNT
jgi:hypothetical protein